MQKKKERRNRRRRENRRLAISDRVVLTSAARSEFSFSFFDAIEQLCDRFSQVKSSNERCRFKAELGGRNGCSVGLEAAGGGRVRAMKEKN